MAKRKRKPGEHEGFKLNLIPDYRSERFTMYILNAETGILQAGTINPDLTDGEVSRAVEALMVRLGEEEAFQKLLLESHSSDPTQKLDLNSEDPNSFVQSFILMNLRSAFERYGPLNTEDTIGILGVIKSSIKRWGVGPHRRGYLTFIEGFLGQAGVKVQQVTDEEADTMGLKQLFEPPKSLEEGD